MYIQNISKSNTIKRSQIDYSYMQINISTEGYVKTILHTKMINIMQNYSRG